MPGIVDLIGRMGLIPESPSTLFAPSNPFGPTASLLSPAAFSGGETYSPSMEALGGFNLRPDAASPLDAFSSAWNAGAQAGGSFTPQMESMSDAALMSAFMSSLAFGTLGPAGLAQLMRSSLGQNGQAQGGQNGGNNADYGNNAADSNNAVDNNYAADNNNARNNSDNIYNNAPGATAGAPGATGSKLADFAAKWAGKSFKAGQTMRCADFVSTMIEQSGSAPPGFKHQMSCSELQKYGKPVGKGELKPGDIVYFKNTYKSGNFTHVGIYLGNGKFVHRPSSNKPVKIDNLNSGYYAQHYSTARRL